MDLIIATTLQSKLRKKFLILKNLEKLLILDAFMARVKLKLLKLGTGDQKESILEEVYYLIKVYIC